MIDVKGICLRTGWSKSKAYRIVKNSNVSFTKEKGPDGKLRYMINDSDLERVLQAERPYGRPFIR